MSKIPVGLQLYTLRNETAEDFVGTLKKVADIGYKTVEFAGYGGIEAKEMKKHLDDLGLKAASSHVSMELLENELNQLIEYNLEIGSDYMMVPFLNKEERLKGGALKETINSIRSIAEECKRQGMQLGYHNHDFEFEKVDGQYILDVLYQEIDADLLVAELDLFWVAKAGLDPKSYMMQYKGRCPVIHVKDMTKDERRVFAEVGQGSIDFPSIFASAEEVGIKHYLVEQDQCERPPLESVKMSMDYLKSIGVA